MAGEGQADAQSSGEQGTWSECPEGDEATRDQPRAAPGWGGRPPAHSSGARGAPPRSSPPPRLPGCAVSSPRPALTLTPPAGLGYSPGMRCPRCDRVAGLLRHGPRVTGSQPREVPGLSPHRRRQSPRAGRPRPRGGGAPGDPARRVGTRSFFFPRQPRAGAGDSVAGTHRAPGFRAGESPGDV